MLILGPWGLPGVGPVYRNRPANAGGMGLILVREQRSSWATTTEPVFWSPGARSTKPASRVLEPQPLSLEVQLAESMRAQLLKPALLLEPALHNKRSYAVRSPPTPTKSSPDRQPETSPRHNNEEPCSRKLKYINKSLKNKKVNFLILHNVLENTNFLS